MNQIIPSGRTARTVAGLALAAASFVATVAHAGVPQLLSEREMSGVYGQGLDGATLQALVAEGSANGAGTGAGAVPGAESPLSISAYGALAALSANGNLTIEQRLAQAEQQAATTGLHNTLVMQRTLSAATGFTVAGTLALTIPTLSLPFFFGFPALPPLPPQQQGNNDKGRGGH